MGGRLRERQVNAFVQILIKHLPVFRHLCAPTGLVVPYVIIIVSGEFLLAGNGHGGVGAGKDQLIGCGVDDSGAMGGRRVDFGGIELLQLLRVEEHKSETVSFGKDGTAVHRSLEQDALVPLPVVPDELHTLHRHRITVMSIKCRNSEYCRQQKYDGFAKS